MKQAKKTEPRPFLVPGCTPEQSQRIKKVLDIQSAIEKLRDDLERACKELSKN
jgi:hypothetical protein